MSAIILLLSTASLVENASYTMDNPAKWARHIYGERLEFIINRNDKPVGQHIVEFGHTDGLDEVKSSTEINIKFLFITAYKFNLSASEYWALDGLSRVESNSNDGGSKNVLLKNFDQNNDLLPTSHWNPLILNDTKVYNTITGKINSIKIYPIGWDKVPTNLGIRDAYRYDYHGDLNDVSAWYDDKGRWVSLKFIARDGSVISYECVKCGT
ncbi:DUF6134 family protein [Pseudemcibacter aquimaris]|uniref:DUF6134 family protein n=1 Tax=Pseudemcibacter aquimaris TaxID=2857064 RepID=UPI0020132D9D|nr:DUF6134 family protein [Pseudemcibacter aquimaris]MCC3861177.1 hypothetical protein [Pseudemcibacter aquimaris]WDU57952.1 hypothetical protein KW060_12200 [Pseudemcibacter aquimaris]